MQLKVNCSSVHLRSIPDCGLLQAYNQLPYPYEPQKSVDEREHITLEQLLCHIFEILQVAMLLN